MASAKDRLHKSVHKAEQQYDKASKKKRNRSHKVWKLRIDVYHCYATEETLHLRGRVLRDKHILVGTSKDSFWTNFHRTIKRMGSDEIDDALLEVQFEDQKVQIRSDEEGYFFYEFPFSTPQEWTRPRKNVTVTLLEAPVKWGSEPVVGIGEIFIPPKDSDFAVVSDVDDTIMETGATSMMKMFWLTFSRNAKTRQAYKGVGKFYHALVAGISGVKNNPLFYVSSSPWNLFDLIRQFIQLKDIPMGPMTLRDFGTDEDKMGKSSHGAHKQGEIEKLMGIYPHLNFILIGDSGQYDAFIYRKVAEDNPGRVLGIFIRDVGGKHPEKVEATIKSANEAGILMVLFPDSQTAAEVAAIKGLMKNPF